jgi:hypothetical protein
MKSPTKIALWISGVIALIPIGYFAFWYFLMSGLFHSIDKSMAVGQKYMDSLTEKDIQVWVNRTKKYLDKYVPKADRIDGKAVPLELQQLGISGIDITTNSVCYVWVGGFEHTSLIVEQIADESFKFTAEYSDESNKVIWPKTLNTNNSQINSIAN